MSTQTIGSRPDLQDYACIFSCRTGFKANQKETDYPIAFLLLVHPGDSHAKLVLIVAHSVHGSVGQLVTFLTQQAMGHLPTLQKLVTRAEASWPVPTWFLHVL